MYPYLTLAAFNDVIIRLVGIIDQRKGFSKFDHIFIALHPIIEHGKFIHYLVLYLFYFHEFLLHKSTIGIVGNQKFSLPLTNLIIRAFFGPFLLQKPMYLFLP